MLFQFARDTKNKNNDISTKSVAKSENKRRLLLLLCVCVCVCVCVCADARERMNGVFLLNEVVSFFAFSVGITKEYRRLTFLEVKP